MWLLLLVTCIGRIVANIEDYIAVWELVTEGVEVAALATIQETVEAVKRELH
jgi:hypothetical protein